MTRQDYERIATALRETRPSPNTLGNDYRHGYATAWNATVEHIADMLARDNPRFDAVRFRNACGYGALGA